MVELRELRRHTQVSCFAGTEGQWIHCPLTIKEWRELKAKTIKDPREMTWALAGRGLVERPCIVNILKDMVIVSQLLSAGTYYKYGKELNVLKNTGHYAGYRNLVSAI